ncbi:flagellar biosynthesis anti-sigma factor FlgM [Parasalinivibrio latis]|uniref:flagellar biosynthesis anti-sigma factor FlgM n=1 Tax=Parasalinivibrio latis TaxID=2952610 RepID=UPI0030E392E2
MIGKIGFTQPTGYTRETSGNRNVRQQLPAQTSVSADMRTINSAKAAVKQAPDVDMDKVAAMKAMLQNGEVSVNLDSLADSMLDYYASK